MIESTRRDLLLLGLSTLLGVDTGCTDSSTHLKRVVMVSVRDRAFKEDSHARVRKAFADEGLVEGRDIALEFEDGIAPSAGGEGPWPAESDRRAREIIATRPAVVVATGAHIHLFKKITRDVPLVFLWVPADPVEWGLVDSYTRPGGSVTGAAFPMLGDEPYKVMALLKQLRPDAKRIGEIWKEGTYALPNTVKDREASRSAASKQGLDYVEIVVPQGAAFAGVAMAIRRARIDLFIGDLGAYGPEGRKFLVRERIPFDGDIYNGGLVYYYASWDETFTNAIQIAAQIVRGASPAAIPVRFPTRYTTRINLNTARELGITVPASMLLQADEIIDK